MASAYQHYLYNTPHRPVIKEGQTEVRPLRRARRRLADIPCDCRALRPAVIAQNNHRPRATMENPADSLVPFALTVCGLGELGRYTARGVSHVLSILDPRLVERPSFAAFGAHRRLELCFDDILEPRAGQVAPQRGHVDAILRFASELIAGPPPEAHMLVHCHMGISRSSATLALLLAWMRPDLPAQQIWMRFCRFDGARGPTCG
jgi:predicted protein tyrosine phosphatase